MIINDRSYYRSSDDWLKALKGDEIWLCQLDKLQNSTPDDVGTLRSIAYEKLGRGVTYGFWDSYNHRVDLVVREVWDIAELSMPKLKNQTIGMLSLVWLEQHVGAGLAKVTRKIVAKEKTEKPVKTVAAPIAQETFADRVKAIMRKAAMKNGQRIETSAKGHAGSYIFHIDAEAFCKAMDDMVNLYEQKLKEFLGGSMNCVQVKRVCFFIGHVIRMHLINATNLQMADIVFAFQGYYDNAQTVKARLSDKKTTIDQNVFLGTFEGLLKKHTN